MAWRVADAARAFDSLSHPTSSRVHGPTELPEPAVPSGASALLGASPSEPLSVAVARMVFRRMLAPGLIVTSARCVNVFLAVWICLIRKVVKCESRKRESHLCREVYAEKE